MKRMVARALRAVARRLDGQPCALEPGVRVVVGDDPVRRGRECVEAIRAYEKFNGRQWRF